MAELSISGRMLVKTLKSDFKKTYGLSLRVYKGGNSFADDNATLASVSSKKAEDFKASGNMLVGNFEKNFEENTGLKIQVTSPNDKELVSNISTISDRQAFYAKPENAHY